MFLILVVLAAIAGLLAKKWLSTGPPTPDMAIEEAKAHQGRARAPGAEQHELPRRDLLMPTSRQPHARADPHLNIEATRKELSVSVDDLRSKVGELTNWRKQLADNREAALATAAVAGFVIGGGVAATISLFRRRRGGPGRAAG